MTRDKITVQPACDQPRSREVSNRTPADARTTWSTVHVGRTMRLPKLTARDDSRDPLLR